MEHCDKPKSSIINNNEGFLNSVDDFCLLKRIDIVMVSPKSSENVGAAVRAISNMGINGKIYIIGSREIINDSSRKLAKHAKRKLDEIVFFDSLKKMLQNYNPRDSVLVLAASARIGSNKRPHPLFSHEAIELAMSKLKANFFNRIAFVFGPEADGLSNDEIELCDWIISIPSSKNYRSLNLAQAILVFSYEAHKFVLSLKDKERSIEKQKLLPLANKLVSLAKDVGFILPRDPFKMIPRLETLLLNLALTDNDLRLLHGFIDQIKRTLHNGKVTYKGRYKHHIEKTISLML